ncbi:MAG: hypothetical protein QXK88_07010 [Desulfurococcaceae archaeon]
MNPLDYVFIILMVEIGVAILMSLFSAYREIITLQTFWEQL